MAHICSPTLSTEAIAPAANVTPTPKFLTLVLVNNSKTESHNKPISDSPKPLIVGNDEGLKYNHRERPRRCDYKKSTVKLPRVRKYTYEIFMTNARLVHGNKYNYDAVKPSDIQGKNSKVLVGCNACYFKWTPTISHHLSDARGCSLCAGVLKWTLERLILAGREIHGDKFDYSSITESMVTGKNVKLPFVCRDCKYITMTNINSHINQKVGCNKCNGYRRWSYERFMEETREMYDNSYDYSKIKESDITDRYSKIDITCNTCKDDFHTTVYGHIKGKGCSRCYGNRTRGETLVWNVLEELKMNYEEQGKLEISGNRRYDFLTKGEKKWNIEYDGQQHFEYGFFDKTKEELLDKQDIDIYKTLSAIESGYKVIRIDYRFNTYGKVKDFLLKCFNANDDRKYYFSDDTLYKHMIEAL